MELTGKLKEEMAQAKSKDEAKEIMENAGMKLTDDELDTVAGGWFDFSLLEFYQHMDRERDYKLRRDGKIK
ncbi:MAG: hypothetical protein K6G09_03215 [Treponema sp.]|nr:hypothetical protein [Treponema sp.]